MTVDDEKPAAEAGSPSQPPAKKTDGNASFLRAARAGNLDKVLEYLKGSTDINTSNANGLNALHLASKEGHTSVVQELLKRGANVDAQTKKGNTALHIASLAGKEEVVRILIEHGAKVNIQSEIGFTPLYMAAQENHAEVVKFLLSNGASPSIATNDGFTPLAVALQQGRDKVVAVLLEADSKGKVKLPALHIAAKKDDVNAASLLLRNEHNVDLQSKSGVSLVNDTTKSGFTPLHIAAHYGNVNVATLLLDQGADISFKARNNITPLHVSCKWGRQNMVVLLLDRGADIDIRTRDGLTPLHCGARSGHSEVVDLLLERRANHSAKTRNGLTPLHMAAQGDHEDCARLLLHYKAPVDDVTVDYLTALHVAAHCGNVNTAKLLLDRKCEVNARALNGFTPLHIACKKNRIKVVELLLKYGAAIEATTESGLTPLHVAAFMGHMNIVLFLLQHNANPDYPTVRGETPLHLAARANQTDIMRILLRNGATVDAKAREQQTPLHIAARLGNVDNVVLLLQHAASPDATTKDMYTPLHIASKEGQEEVASVLIDQGASLNLTTKKGFTPLHIAAKYGNIKVARLLLQRGANPDVQGKNGLTPLHVAAHYNNVNVALLLLDHNASPHCTAKNGYTPLHIAAKKNQMDIATTLLEYNAKPNAESKNGFTPLHLASQEGHTDMVSLLLEHGAASKHPAHNGLTPMHLCAQEDKVNVAEVLVKYGADKDPSTKAGYTPLHTACHFGQINMIRFLLEQDADVNAKTKQGYTPLHQAAQQGHVLVIKLLLKYNASPNITANNGQTPLSLAQHLGYISVEEVLKEVTEVQSIKTGVTMEEKYKVQAPEMMQETFMTDSEDEGEDDTILGDTNYSYLNTDQFIGMKDDSIVPAKGMPDRDSMSHGHVSFSPDETMEALWGTDPSVEKKQMRGKIFRVGDPQGSMIPETPSYLPRTPFDKKYQDEFFAIDAQEESYIKQPERTDSMRLKGDSQRVTSGEEHKYRGRDSFRSSDDHQLMRPPDAVHSMELEDDRLGSFNRNDTMKHIWGGDGRRPQNDEQFRPIDLTRKANVATAESFELSQLSPEERAESSFVFTSPEARYVSGRLVGPDGKPVADVRGNKVHFDAQEFIEQQSAAVNSLPATQYGDASVSIQCGPDGKPINSQHTARSVDNALSYRMGEVPGQMQLSELTPVQYGDASIVVQRGPDGKFVYSKVEPVDGSATYKEGTVPGSVYAGSVPQTVYGRPTVVVQPGPDGKPIMQTVRSMDPSASYRQGDVPTQLTVEEIPPVVYGDAKVFVHRGPDGKMYYTSPSADQLQVYREGIVPGFMTLGEIPSAVVDDANLVVYRRPDGKLTYAKTGQSFDPSVVYKEDEVPLQSALDEVLPPESGDVKIVIQRDPDGQHACVQSVQSVDPSPVYQEGMVPSEMTLGELLPIAYGDAKMLIHRDPDGNLVYIHPAHSVDSSTIVQEGEVPCFMTLDVTPSTIFDDANVAVYRDPNGELVFAKTSQQFNPLVVFEEQDAPINMPIGELLPADFALAKVVVQHNPDGKRIYIQTNEGLEPSSVIKEGEVPPAMTLEELLPTVYGEAKVLVHKGPDGKLVYIHPAKSTDTSVLYREGDVPSFMTLSEIPTSSDDSSLVVERLPNGHLAYAKTRQAFNPLSVYTESEFPTQTPLEELLPPRCGDAKVVVQPGPEGQRIYMRVNQPVDPSSVQRRGNIPGQVTLKELLPTIYEQAKIMVHHNPDGKLVYVHSAQSIDTSTVRRYGESPAQMTIGGTGATMNGGPAVSLRPPAVPRSALVRYGPDGQPIHQEDQVEAQVQRSVFAGMEFSPGSAPYGQSLTSPYGGGSYIGQSFNSTFDPDNVVVDRTPVYSGKLKWKSFLVSFMVDARGGAMRGCRHSGVRMIVPPGMASQPTRVTCRLVKKEKVLVPPPLMEGEALASRIIELGPANAQFLGPVILEIPHFASLRGREREIVILRSNNGEKWSEHSLEASDDIVQEILKDSFEELETSEELAQKRITRILTTEFPQYFAIVSRVRQETNQIGADGGVISSTVVPQVQAVFPEGALTKNIKVGLQAQPVNTDIVTKMFGNRVAVSPIVTVEPRRRKFHKPITLTIPVPKAAQKGMINQYGGDAPTLRLLCSITGGTQAAQWEDITGTTPLTFVNDCVSFTTTVSARFWLMDCQNIGEASRMATELYRETMNIPFMSKFVVFAKRHEEKEARLRAFCMTDDKMDKTLETQEHFVEVARSRDVEVQEGKPQFIEMAGNLVPVTKSGEQLYINFHAFRENRLPFIVRIRDDDQDPVGRIAFMKEPKVARGEAPQHPICNLNVTLPEYTGPEPAPDLDEKTIKKLREKYTIIRTTTTTESYLGAELRLTQISDAVQDDWVQLAEELQLPSSQIEKCRMEFETASDQCLYMLHTWAETNGSQATGNELERALRKIGREDVVNKCMYNVHEVTDDVEKAMAKMQIEQSAGFEDLQAEVKSRDSTLQRGASLDVSYDEQDLVKESESAAEEESEEDRESHDEDSLLVRRVADKEDTQSLHSVQEEDLSALIDDRRKPCPAPTEEEQEALAADKKAAYSDFVALLDHSAPPIPSNKQDESGDEIVEEDVGQSHQDRRSDDFVSRVEDMGVESSRFPDQEPEEDSEFVLQQQALAVESCPPPMAEQEDFEESGYVAKQISVEVTEPTEPAVYEETFEDQVETEDFTQSYEPGPELEQETSEQEVEPEPEPATRTFEEQVDETMTETVTYEQESPRDEPQFAQEDYRQEEFTEDVETTPTEAQRDFMDSSQVDQQEEPAEDRSPEEDGQVIEEASPEVKDIIDRLAEAELTPEGDVVTERQPEYQPDEQMSDDEAVESGATAQEMAAEAPYVEEWRETNETGFVQRSVTKTTYSPDEPPKDLLTEGGANAGDVDGNSEDELYDHFEEEACYIASPVATTVEETAEIDQYDTDVQTSPEIKRRQKIVEHYSTPIDVTFESGLDHLIDDDDVRAESDDGSTETALKRSHSLDSDNGELSSSPDDRSRHHSFPEKIKHHSLDDELLTYSSKADFDDDRVQSEAEEDRLDMAEGGVKPKAASSCQREQEKEPAYDSARVHMVKEIHKKTYFIGGEEKTEISETSNISTDGKTPPPELQSRLQQLMDSFGEGSGDFDLHNN